VGARKILTPDGTVEPENPFYPMRRWELERPFSLMGLRITFNQSSRRRVHSQTPAHPSALSLDEKSCSHQQRQESHLYDPALSIMANPVATTQETRDIEMPGAAEYTPE